MNRLLSANRPSYNRAKFTHVGASVVSSIPPASTRLCGAGGRARSLLSARRVGKPLDSRAPRTASPGDCRDPPRGTEDALAFDIRRVLAHLSEARRAAVRAHFIVGDDLCAIRQSASVGSRPIQRVAATVGLDESGLQRIARMAQIIREPERSTLISLGGARGFTLTASHFEELALAPRVEQRQRLARLALADDLTVRAMRLLRLRDG